MLFAAYPLEPVTARPSVQQPAIDPQMGNVLVPLALSPQQLRRLGTSGVVASQGDYPEFHDLYQETARANLPVFVTSDALLHVSHLAFDQILSALEEAVLDLGIQRHPGLPGIPIVRGPGQREGAPPG